MEILKFAAIDIGSNAIRLLFMNVINDGINVYFKKSSLVRVPIRLGTDTFIKGEISAKNIARLVKTMNAFKNLMDVHEVVSYRACATSAMREAKNGLFVVSKILDETNIKIDLITGKEEAKIIFSNKIADTLSANKNYLYVDVGGGSTEITLFSNGKSMFTSSFGIGTLKILNNLVGANEFIELKEALENICASCSEIEIIGSGGNINKLQKYSNISSNKQITYKELKHVYNELYSFSYEELMTKFDMNPDRADVIIPAATIFLTIMEWTCSEIIHIPKIGVSDGIIHTLYKEYTAKVLKLV